MRRLWLAAGTAQLVIIGAATAPAQTQPATAQTAQAPRSEAEEASRLYTQMEELFGAGRYAEAQALAERILEIRQRVLGPEHPDTLGSVDDLGRLHTRQGRYAEAEALYRRALEGRQRARGSDHPDTLTSINNLGVLYLVQGRYAEAEPLLRRVVESRERVLGREHDETLIAVNNLASAYRLQGRYAEAEPLFRRVLEVRERVLGRDHPNTLTSVNNLALLYNQQGRHAEAEPLYQRALEDRERVLGRDHPNTLISVNNLAYLYLHQRRYAEAEPLYRRALEDRERRLGREHPDTLISVNNLADVYHYQGLYAEAEPLYRRALADRERVLGRDHPDTLESVRDLAMLYAAQERHSKAEPLFRRAVEGLERALGREHPQALEAIEGFVRMELHQPATAQDALSPARTLVSAVRKRRQAGGSAQQAQAQREREASSASARFALFADAAWAVASHEPAQQVTLRSEAFAALQDAVAGAADRSVAEQAARRYVSGRNPELAEMMRERQRLENEWTRLDADLAASFGAGPGGGGDRPAEIRTRLEQVQARLEAIDARLRTEAPDYFALIEPTPLDVATAQRLLAPDEAILLAVPSRFGTHVIAVTHTDLRWVRSEWNADRIRSAVQRLRWDAGALVEGTEQELARLHAERLQEERARFDRTAAHGLYQQLVAPVAPMIADKQRIYVAAGGALASLPFSLLVSVPPTGADDDPAALRATYWFGDEVALIHIPSIQSLALLRQASASGAGGGFLGVGDPVLAGTGTARGRGTTRGLPSARQLLRVRQTRDGALLADVRELRRMPRLPGTARELEAVRRTLGAPPRSLLLASNATEPNVRAADLSNDSIIVFSTHGLTASEAAGIGEAGLVLTPPAEPREGDDGFLTASEVTTLRLNADWVILSACNTATGDGTANAGLGQLARAFFYAGARNLLASHWPVSDEVAPILITRTLALERAGTRRAEAFRQAMREIRMDASHDTADDSWAHPFYWAPFVLIGDAGR